MHEIWKPVVGFEGLYEVSDRGRVKRIGTGRGSKKGRILKQTHRKDGRLSVHLYRGCIGKGVLVHRLVLEAFVGPCPEGMECCHNDGNPQNNTIGNLRWDTHQNNIQDTVSHGKTNRGSRSPMAKLTEADIPYIFEMRARGMLVREISDVFGVSEIAVYDVLKRRRWAHVQVDLNLLSAVEPLLGHTRGERHSTALLTEPDILAIYRMRKKGYLQREIAATFGVALPTIGSILQGRSWSYLYHHFTDN